MKYRQLGRSALKVSELCLGTMNFGPRTSKEDSFAILNNAVSAGINFVDTANQYGGSLGVGTTEKIIGSWLAEDLSRRDNLVLATKVYEPMSDDINDRGLSARHIQSACEASLQRLGVDCIDLYQMHHLDRVAPVEEIWQAMDRLVEQGKIIYVGSSNFPGWKIAQTNEKAAARQRLGLVSEQSLYNLVERRVELEVLPACAEYGVGVITWSPLAGGLLSGADSSNEGRRKSDAVQKELQLRRHQLEQFHQLCTELGETPAAVALSWNLAQLGVTSVIVGPADLPQLQSVLHVPELTLSADVLERLDTIFPPCGAAPEAYAW
ncbi:MAG: aldo/keto reductase [Kordiimonadaceae bacterium]|nr:aldo/keto reductase [Kordiimonadaceae bacterium]MBO6569343.1 aldo/keto reductase [Kordiimonadaceae bacterium]MBO6964818.1 aldo/keto reductase [Kordiimonadaceae bacterium]